MIKALIFDVTGVLTQAKFTDVYRSFAKELGLPENILMNYDKEHIENQNIGREHFHDMFTSISKHTPDLSEASFKQAWVRIITKVTTVNVALIKLIDNWRKTYTCGILSNTTEGRAIFDESIKLYEHFDFVLESHKEHMKKPNPEFYLLALQKANCEPEEAIYVDDQQRHVDAAKSLGIHGIVFVSNEQFKLDLATHDIIV